MCCAVIQIFEILCEFYWFIKRLQQSGRDDVESWAEVEWVQQKKCDIWLDLINQSVRSWLKFGVIPDNPFEWTLMISEF